MKKIFVVLMLLVISSSLFPLHTFAIVSQSSYAITAEKTLSNYIQKLENADYSDEEILGALYNLRDRYVQKTKLRNYRGTTKKKINAVIQVIDSHIATIQVDINSNEDISLDIPSVIPKVPNYGPAPVSTPSYTPQQSTVTTLAGVTNVGPVHKINLNRNSGTKLYEGYDVFVYTPSVILQKHPPVTTFMAPTHLVVNTYDSYVTTVGFGSETSLTKIQALREKIGNGIRITPQTQELYLYALENYPFSTTALTEKTGNSTYETYLLFLAKDNSEAFVIDFVQSGKKKQQYLLGFDYENMVNYWSGLGHYTKFSLNSQAYKAYKSYIYTPSARLSQKNIFQTIGFDPAKNTEKSTQIYSTPEYINNGNKYITQVSLYLLPHSNIQTIESSFKRIPSYSSVVNLETSSFLFWGISALQFSQQQTAEGDYRTYNLLISDDGSEASIVEYKQIPL